MWPSGNSEKCFRHRAKLHHLIMAKSGIFGLIVHNNKIWHPILLDSAFKLCILYGKVREDEDMLFKCLNRACVFKLKNSEIIHLIHLTLCHCWMTTKHKEKTTTTKYRNKWNSSTSIVICALNRKYFSQYPAKYWWHQDIILPYSSIVSRKQALK